MFAPERMVLSGMGRQLVRFEGTDLEIHEEANSECDTGLKDEPIANHVWSTEYFKRDTLASLHTIFFGAFRVVDSHISDSSVFDDTPESPSPHLSSTPSTGYSYIDLAWGSESGLLAGVHRFSVSHDMDLKSGEEKEGSVVITFECEANTRDWAGLLGGTLGKFHLWYSMWLFREGVAEVLKQ